MLGGDGGQSWRSNTVAMTGRYVKPLSLVASLPPLLPSLSMPPCFLSTSRKNRPTANGGRCIKQPPVLFKGSFVEGGVKLCVNCAKSLLLPPRPVKLYISRYFVTAALNLHCSVCTWLFEDVQKCGIHFYWDYERKEYKKLWKKNWEYFVSCVWYCFTLGGEFEDIFLSWEKKNIEALKNREERTNWDYFVTAFW